jgi:transcriptional regulator with XRE-family HTH domain
MSIDQVSVKLREYRNKRGLTQADVAKKAGIHVSYYARIERAEVTPTLTVLEKILKVLKITSSDVLPF